MDGFSDLADEEGAADSGGGGGSGVASAEGKDDDDVRIEEDVGEKMNAD
jgi:hypothetical protein